MEKGSPIHNVEFLTVYYNNSNGTSIDVISQRSRNLKNVSLYKVPISLKTVRQVDIFIF